MIKKFVHGRDLYGIGFEWKTSKKTHRLGVHPFLFAPFKVSNISWRLIRWREYVRWVTSRFIYIARSDLYADYRILCFGYAWREIEIYGYFKGDATK